MVFITSGGEFTLLFVRFLHQSGIQAVFAHT